MENNGPYSTESLWRRNTSGLRSSAKPSAAGWEIESQLTDALTRLPDSAVPSNFKSRVMAALELEVEQADRSRSWTWNWRWLMPRVAFAAALFFIGLALQHQATVSQRTAMVKNLASVTSVRALPNVDILENLDAIQRMSQSGRADGELLAVLQ